MYAFDAAVNNAVVVDVPRRADFSIDVASLLAAAEKRTPRMLFLTSPNNPDGCLLPEPDLVQLLTKLPGTLVVLDEAYVEFSGTPSRVPWVLRYPNLCVLRTFSKRAGLAGLRVGYGAFPADLIPYLWKAKQPYNVSVAAEEAACAALSNPGYLEHVRDALVQERDRLFNVLSSVAPGLLSPFPSAANFILCRVTPKEGPAAAAAAQLQKRLMHEEGIMVRYYSSPAQLAGCIRVSVGTPAHTDALEAALKRLLA